MDLGKLNPPQREAVTHGGGPLLVLAGAGSGKTRVITHRIAHLLRTGIPARAIAALTFTNKAAGEMRERVGALVGDRGAVGELTVSTFHSLGLSILKEERAALGFPRGFVIYDTADQLGCVREILRRLDTGGRRFDVKAILTRISLAKNAFVGPDEYRPAEGDDYDDLTAEVYPRYQEALRAYAAVDFDDLITEVVRLWRTRAEVRDKWRRRYHHVMVDEFQDTNRAQLLMVEELVAEHQNLCVVGDDDQSIYAWRGAEPANILEFAQRFPGAHVVKLEQNYRSTPAILAAANAVIANNRDRYGKQLWTATADRPSLVCAVAPDVATEAKFVAREIEALRQSEGRTWSDFAVLYRSNIQARELEEELRACRVPYVMYGGQQFYERKEVKDVLAYLRLALNPRDDIALRRVINYPARGIGTTTIERLATRAQAARQPLWAALVEAGGSAVHPERPSTQGSRREPYAQDERAAPEGSAESKDEIRGASRAALTGFVSLVKTLDAQLRGGGVVAAVRSLIDAIDLYGDIRSASPSVTASQRRIDNVEDIMRALDRHEQKHPGPAALLDFLRLLSLQTSDDDAEEDGKNKVVLTTLHGAKGLEFPVVFFVGLEEDIIPHARTLQPQATDVMDPDHVSDVSEERRLAYVGITRAREKLYLTRTSFRIKYGRAAPRTPSRFLIEIPPELIETRDLVAEAREKVGEDEVKNFFSTFDFEA